MINSLKELATINKKIIAFTFSLKKKNCDIFYLSYDEPRERHAGDWADQLDAAAVVDVPVPHGELLGLRLIVVD